MKNKRIQLIVLAMITLSIFAFSGCSSSSTTSGTANGTATSSTSGTTVYGKVTGISGSEITIALGTMNEGNEGGGDQPTGEKLSGEAPTGDQTSGTKATGETPPAQPTDGTAVADGTTPPEGTTGGAPEMLTLTGESQPITLSDTITITKQTMPEPGIQSSSTTAISSESASSADIVVGSIVMITYTGNSDEIASIQIMGGGQQGIAQTTN